MSVPLFQASGGAWVTDSDLIQSLRVVRADEADVLFVHSEMSFGLPNPDLKRSELLGAVWRCLQGLEVPTLVVPTFTFSFCNGHDYDVRWSRSKMGALKRVRSPAPRSFAVG